MSDLESSKATTCAEIVLSFDLKTAYKITLY